MQDHPKTPEPEVSTPAPRRHSLKIFAGMVAAAGFTLIFWLILGFITNQKTPMTSVIRHWPRWWDVIIIPVWIIITYITLQHHDFRESGPYSQNLMWVGGISGFLCAVLTALLTLRFAFTTSLVAGVIATVAVSAITILALIFTGRERTGQAKVILREWIIGCWIGAGSTLCIIFGTPLSIPVIAVTLALLVAYFLLG